MPKRLWTDALKAQIVELLQEHGRDYTAIAAAMGLTNLQIKNYCHYHKELMIELLGEAGRLRQYFAWTDELEAQFRELIPEHGRDYAAIAAAMGLTYAQIKGYCHYHKELMIELLGEAGRLRRNRMQNKHDDGCFCSNGPTAKSTWRGVCRCPNPGCGWHFCPRTGKRMEECSCRRRECGGDYFCPDNPGRRASTCLCGGNFCAGYICRRSLLPRNVCPCRSGRLAGTCGVSLCEHTYVPLWTCKCGRDGCGAALAARILNRFIGRVKPRRGEAVSIFNVSAAEADAFFGMPADWVVESCAGVFFIFSLARIEV